MLRHRNIKADDTHNQGIFIGDYDQGTEEKVKSVPEPCNCWKVFALLLLLIAGTSISLNIFQFMTVSSSLASQMEAERGNVEECRAELRVMEEEIIRMEEAFKKVGGAVTGAMDDGDTPPTPHPQLQDQTPPLNGGSQEEGERRKREEEERIQREEQERLLREEQERLQKEEQEIKAREEQERLQREEQERKAREEQERLQREEQERLKREEQERKQREEQERLQKEEQERKQKEEQERLQKEEEQRKQQEEQKPSAE